MKPFDYTAFYDQETYLFDEVSNKFAEAGELSAFDFYCIFEFFIRLAHSI